MDYHSHHSSPSGNISHIPVSFLMWPPGRYKQWEILTCYPHSISSKDTEDEGQVLPPSISTLSARELYMSHHNLHSELMILIQDEVSIRSAFRKCVVNSRHIKYLICKFEFTQQDRISNKQKKLIERINQHQFSWWDCDLIQFKPGHQSYTNWEMKSACFSMIILNFSYIAIINKYVVPKSIFNKSLRRICPIFWCSKSMCENN